MAENHRWNYNQQSVFGLGVEISNMDAQILKKKKKKNPQKYKKQNTKQALQARLWHH